MIITATLWNTKGWSFSVRYHINIVAKKFKFKTHKTSPSKVFSQIWKKKLKKYALDLFHKIRTQKAGNKF